MRRLIRHQAGRRLLGRLLPLLRLLLLNGRKAKSRRMRMKLFMDPARILAVRRATLEPPRKVATRITSINITVDDGESLPHSAASCAASYFQLGQEVPNMRCWPAVRQDLLGRLSIRDRSSQES